ncbi:MAG: ABC transporter permease [Candidatus Aenigmatarchaeota archaeon]
MNSLTHRKLRSWLTVLGIVVGVAAVVALVSVGQGLQQSVQNQLGGLGANLITISLGFQRAGGGFGFGGERATTTFSNLTDTDIRIIRSTPGIMYVDGIISGRAAVSFSGQSSLLSIQGVDTSVWKFMTTEKLEAGRYLSTGDTYVAVVGYNAAHGLYKHDILLNSIISIENHSFRVVGILQSGASTIGGGGGGSTIYIPRENARQVLTTDLASNQYSSISAEVSQSSDVQTVVNQLTTNLMLTRHVTNITRDFSVTSSLSVQQSISSITSTVTYFLAGIAGISLFVGGIGIANTMFMSVMERTRQIGVLKSLGTTNGEVMKLFLTESGLLGLIGGVIGVMLGIILSALISLIGGGGLSFFGGRGGGQGLQTVVTPEVVFLAIGFSVFIGAVSGLFPARRAAKLEPVEALRYE